MPAPATALAAQPSKIECAAPAADRRTAGPLRGELQADPAPLRVCYPTMVIVPRIPAS